jgi:hypothetical protein
MIDLERWPLLVAQPPSAKPLSERGNGPAALDAFLRELEHVLSRRREFVLVFDVRGVRTRSNCRKRLTDWTNAHDSSIRTYMKALAVVVGSEVERADVTSVFWNLNQSYHARILHDASEAEQWLLAELARGEHAN